MTADATLMIADWSWNKIYSCPF